MPVAFLQVEALVLREASSVLALLEAEHAHVFEYDVHCTCSGNVIVLHSVARYLTL